MLNLDAVTANQEKHIKTAYTKKIEQHSISQTIRGYLLPLRVLGNRETTYFLNAIFLKLSNET